MPLGPGGGAVRHRHVLLHGRAGLHHLVLAAGHHRREHQLHHAHQLERPHPLQLLQRHVPGARAHPTGMETGNQSISQSINQSVDQSINQSVDQSVHQSIKESVCSAVKFYLQSAAVQVNKV